MKMRLKKGFHAPLLAAAVMVFLAGEAAAASPKGESVVTGETITLGDVFDGVTENAGYVLAPAPRPGGTKTLNARDLQRISGAFGLGWRSGSGLDQVVIRREANEIDRYAIEAALQEKIAELSPGSRFDMQLSDRGLQIYLSPEFPATVEAGNISIDRLKGEFVALLAAPSLGNPVVKKEVRGRLVALAEAPVLAHPLRPGDVISREDISYVEMPARDITPAVIMSEEKLIGMTPRRGIAAGKLVTAADLEEPVMVKKGDIVVMTLKTGAMNLTAQGRALQSGAEGETVRILNTGSNQVIEGVVTGPQAIAVAPPQRPAAEFRLSSKGE